MNHDTIASQHHIATLDSPEMNYIFWQVTPHITQWFLISRQNEYANALLLSVILLYKLVGTYICGGSIDLFVRSISKCQETQQHCGHDSDE